MQTRQISIFLENKPHQLSAICRTLADAGINIATLSLADTSDFGIARLIVSDSDTAQKVLVDAGHAVNVCAVVAVCVPNRPGGMAGVMDVLDAAGVNIEYSYAMDVDKMDGEAVLVFRLSDNQKADAALKAAGYAMMDEDTISKLSKQNP